MDRRAFITLLGGSVLAAPLATKAQQAGKVPKVGWLSMGTPASPMAVTSSEAFRQGLRDNGYLEGQNITIESGGLMSYGPNLLELHRSAANYVAKILRGAKPGDLPIAEPTKFELVMNLKTAKVLGLTIPQTLLLRADQIIR